MIPVQCRESHRPPEKYGDCVRACVASIMELDAEAVPHFFECGNDANQANATMRAFLKRFGLQPFFMHYPAVSLDTLLNEISEQNPDIHFILYCRIEGGGHAVVCNNGKVVHNPNWFQSPIIGPIVDEHWTILLLVKC